MAYDQTDEASVAALDRIIGADPDNAGVRAQLQETIWSSPKLLLTGIEEQAQTLGITDPNYLWIAARSLLSPLPEGWAQYKDQNGSPYYLNEKTNETTWDPPAMPKPPAPASESLPAPWTAVLDPASGRSYYYNSATGAVSWNKPTA